MRKESLKKQVQLGRTNMKVYPVGLGCMGFSHASGAPTDHATAVKTMVASSWNIGKQI